MALALPVLAALVVGVLLGGSPRQLAELRLNASWLLFAALGLQIVAFPFAFLPWQTGETTGTVLWLGSYVLLVVAALLNVRIPGVALLAAGLAANVLAVAANRGTMPVLPEAMHAAGRTDAVQANSTAATNPTLAWLVDRWPAPDWIPFANVFSVGDVLIAAGAFVVVLAAMGVRIPRLRRSATA